MRKTIIWLVVIIIIAVGAYYLTQKKSSDNTSTTTQDTSQNQPDENTDTTPNGGQGNLSVLTLNTGTDANLGTYLVGPNGMTLYMYTKDTANTSNCYDQCATNWPPYTISSTAAASLAGGVGINSPISTTTRTDGTLQVTYKGEPLYYWVKDTKPGDTSGQGVGSVWYVVKP